MTNEKQLIYVNDALEVLCGYCDVQGCCPPGKCAEYQKISKLPTVDAVEVVHGRWDVEKEKDTFGYIIHLKCSQCNNRNSKRANYCPNCGAKMDLKEVS